MSKYFAKHSNDDLVAAIESVKVDSTDLLASLEEKLKDGIVVFFYRKSNGDVRKAIGTKHNESIPIDRDKYDSLLIKSKLFIDSVDAYNEEDEESIQRYSEQFEILRGTYLSQTENKVKKKKAPNPGIITYYDFEAKAPRAMKKDSLIAIF